MSVTSLISLARTLTNTNSTQISDAQALEYLNIVYKDMQWRIISEVDDQYFWDSFTTDTVAGQNEYVLPIADSTTLWIKRVTRAECKYQSTDTYKKLLSADTISNYHNPDQYIRDNNSTSSPFYDVRDNSIFIYPEPDESITDWLVVYGTITLIDLVSAWAESTIFPINPELRDYHSILSIWMKQYIYSQLRLDNEKNDAINEYETKVAWMIRALRDRTNINMEQQLPNRQYYIR